MIKTIVTHPGGAILGIKDATLKCSAITSLHVKYKLIFLTRYESVLKPAHARVKYNVTDNVLLNAKHWSSEICISVRVETLNSVLIKNQEL